MAICGRCCRSPRDHKLHNVVSERCGEIREFCVIFCQFFVGDDGDVYSGAFLSVEINILLFGNFGASMIE